MEHKYNLRSPAVKRLMREAKELHQPTELYYAQPLEDNLFEWHFSVRGPPDTEFAGGRYHGRITLPPEYPMKPPSIMLLTPNGRFEIGRKICLSMSAHHPETWQPSWSIRTVLMAIIGFMPSKGAGAIGALDYTPKERSALATKSLDWKCSACGSCNRNSLLDEGSDSSKTKEAEQEIAEITGQIAFKEEDENNKKKEATTAQPSMPSPSTTEPIPTDTSAAAGVFPSYPSMPGYMANPWLQSYQQQYMAYNPYYTYMFGNQNGFGGQVPGIGEPAAPIGAPSANQSQPINQNVVPNPTTNNIAAPQAPANQNSFTNSSQSNVRQRTTAGQQATPSQGAPAQPVNVGTAAPRSTHAAMVSLIVMWFVVVSVIALILRRIFMTS